jgi:hypothetical protein
MSNYNVIFEGNISSGYQLQDVKRNLADLFKLNEEKVDILFAKPRVVLKKGLDYDSAQKYRKALLKTGAICNVKEVGGSSGKLQMENAAPPGPGVQALNQSVPPPVSGSTASAATRDTAELNTALSEETSSEKEPRRGFGDIIAGIVIIGIGFTYGGSVFLGNPGPLDYFFDGLGVFWIGRGIYKLTRG